MRNKKLVHAFEAELDKVAGDKAEARAVQIEAAGFTVQASLKDADRLGVVIDELRVTGRNGELGNRAQALQSLRPNGERIHPVEVAPILGGARLRTRAEDIQHGEFFEVGLDHNTVEVHRYRKSDSGKRTRAPFTLTRKHLSELIDDIAGVLKD